MILFAMLVQFICDRSEPISTFQRFAMLLIEQDSTDNIEGHRDLRHALISQ